MSLCIKCGKPHYGSVWFHWYKPKDKQGPYCNECQRIMFPLPEDTLRAALVERDAMVDTAKVMIASVVKHYADVDTPGERDLYETIKEIGEALNGKITREWDERAEVSTDTIARLRSKLGAFAAWLDNKQCEAVKTYSLGYSQAGKSDAFDEANDKFWEIMEADGNGYDSGKCTCYVDAMITRARALAEGKG